MIVLDRVTVTYADGRSPVLADVSLVVPEGELCLVVGPSGTGKSTLLGALHGHVPHFTGGRLSGRVTVAGRDTRDHPPRELADVVGVVHQDPMAGFVTDTVEEELAYGMELRAVPPPVMRKRVEESLDLLGLAELRRRPLRTLSGGQQQRVAIAAALTALPSVLVLDEPTSALDPNAAEEVLAAILRLVDDIGLTVVLAEHRLERVAQYADRVVLLPGDGSIEVGEPAAVLGAADIAPPVVHLGRLAGWSPVPLSVRDARRQAAELRHELAGAEPGGRGHVRSSTGPGAALTASGVTVRHGDVVAVRSVDLSLAPGEVVSLMGRNGSGKSSLLWALQGTGRRAAGHVHTGGVDPASLRPEQRRQAVALVPQSAADLLYLPTIGAECRRADEESAATAGTARSLLDRLLPGLQDDTHPRDLSEGGRLVVALAVQLAAAPPVVLLDEPTRGLDHLAKERLGILLRELARTGRAVLVATHDVEFAAATVDRVVVLAEGEVVADGTAAEILCASPAFAPQVAKVLAPQRWLDVAEVAAALATPVRATS